MVEQIPKQMIGQVHGELSVSRHGNIVVISAKDDIFRPFGVLILDLERGSLGSLLVAEGYRRKGVATALLKEAERIAKEAGLDRIQAGTHFENEVAHNLLRKLGYFEMTVAEKRL